MSSPIGRYIICPNSFHEDHKPHVVKIEDCIIDTHGAIAVALCNLCCINFQITKWEHLDNKESIQKKLEKLKSLTGDDGKCHCEIGLLMRLGCQCKSIKNA